MDLLSALPEDIFHEIATYLDGYDVLESSMVCRRWYQMFGQSKECMKKITAKYTNYNRRHDLNTLLSSERKYQNIKIGFQRTQNMKDTPVEQNILAILNKFAKSMVSLETTHDFPRVYALPKLKELIFIMSDHYGKVLNNFYSNGLMTKCTPDIIKKLSIKRIANRNKLDDKAVKLIMNGLTNMRNLKSFSFNQKEILDALQTAEYHFRLEEVELNFCYESKVQISAATSFIKAHQSTLKVIKLREMHLEDIALFFADFPKLHSLYINSVYRHYGTEIDFPQNSTIKNLIITGYRPITSQQLLKMFIKLKQLKHFKGYSLCWGTICAATHSSTIETVEYKVLDADVTEDRRKQINNYRRVQFIKKPLAHVF